MEVMQSIPPDCYFGYSREQLERLLAATGRSTSEFDRWMRGQTGALCTGLRYDHDIQEYVIDENCVSGHGPVVYTWDVERFLSGRPIID